jgi:hypothetical protein
MVMPKTLHHVSSGHWRDHGPLTIISKMTTLIASSYGLEDASPTLWRRAVKSLTYTKMSLYPWASLLASPWSSDPSLTPW